MRRAIVTKWIGQTNTKPDRISAKCSFLPHIIISRDEYEESEDAHRAAAQKLADKYKWQGPMIMNQLDNGKYVHVFLERNQIIVEKLEYEILKAKAF